MERTKTSYEKISCRKAKGITLIALVITIVILIILATVAISFVFGEEGLISRAQQAAEMTERQNLMEQIELSKAEVAAENGGKVTVEDFFEKLEENGIIGSVEGDVTDNGDGTYTVITNDGHEIEVTVTEDGNIETEYVGKSDEPGIRKIEVSKTSNSVTITVETRNAEGGKFTYSYKKNSEEGENAWQEIEANTDSNTCTINKLQQSDIYNIKVVLEVDGERIERIVNVQVGEMPAGTVAISFTNPTWQDDGTASITINNKEEGYTLQYQIVRAEGGMPEENGWTEIASGTEITGLKYGDTVYGRLWDGTNGSSPANATIEDNVMPEKANIVLSAQSIILGKKITATITLMDNQSGVDITGSKWLYNTNSGEIGTEEASYTNNFEGTENPVTAELQATEAGTYYLHVLTKDKAGNKVETISEGVVVNEKSEVEMAKEAGTIFEETKQIEDEHGNKITVPEGFKIAGGENGSGDTVQQGIVIEDAFSEDENVRGSQYVWIPVGTFIKDDETESNEIVLGRYTFADDEYGTPQLQQAAFIKQGEELVANYTTPKVIDLYYSELVEYRPGVASNGLDGLNATAYDLDTWMNSVKNNGGYYIARYEASYASGSSVADYKCASKISQKYSEDAMSYVSGTLWNNIIQVNASKVAVNTYKDSNNGVKSDLMNSYAFDTAIVFIQECGYTKYAYQKSKNSSLANTGENNDEVCKINDLASNCTEWTTEYSSYATSTFTVPCEVRGGRCGVSYYCTTSRYSYGRAAMKGENVSFRVNLYLTENNTK